MSERQYFSLRYAIPGFTLILVFIAINHVPLLKIMKATEVSEIFAASLAFLALFSGSALGFLISQGWWWWFQYKVGIWNIVKFENAISAFFEKYDLEKPCDTDEKRKFLSVLDYVAHSNADEKILALAERRWDMYHILSSTHHTLRIGIVTAIICRFLFCEYFLVEPLRGFSFPNSMLTLLENPEFWILISIFVGIAFLLFFTEKSRQWAVIAMATLYEARIRTSTVRKDKLKKAFHDILKNTKKRT